ncbi:hypothetical protein PIB30_104675, partial [Stylosanthes scabra]|nr:hypothetical protein [Stylosanthes scabra]
MGMAVGFGIDRDANGNGTTPEDIQKIIGSIWNMEGIIFGGAVDTVASEMAYQITPGSVLINMGDQRRIIAPFDRIKVPTDPNPGTSTRRDKVYVKQNLSNADGSNLVEIKVTQGSLPARSILLADYEVPAGATTTAGAVDRSNRVFARSVGGSYGQVAKSVDKDTSVRSTGVFKMGQQQLFFGTQWHGVAPGDRDCTLHFVSNVSSGRGNDGVPVDEVGTVLYTFYLNGTKLCRFERKFDKSRRAVRGMSTRSTTPSSGRPTTRRARAPTRGWRISDVVGAPDPHGDRGGRAASGCGVRTESGNIKVRKSDLARWSTEWWAPWSGGVLLVHHGPDGVDRPIAAGPITGWSAETAEDLTLDWKGIREILAHRVIAQDLKFSGVSLGTIAWRVVHDMSEIKPGGGLPIVHGSPEETVTDDADHQRTYESWNLANNGIDKRLTEISEVIGGPDIMFRPQWANDEHTGVVWAMVHGTEGRPRIAQTWTADMDTTAPRAGLSDLSVKSEASHIVTRVWATGSGEGAGVARTYVQDLD